LVTGEREGLKGHISVKSKTFRDREMWVQTLAVQSYWGD
jgi:hypothetical protein